MRRRVGVWVRSAALCMRWFGLAKALLERIEIGAVRGQEQEPVAGSADRLADSGPFEIIQIVHDDNVAGRERRHLELLDIVGKALPLTGWLSMHEASIRSQRSAARKVIVRQ